jgi:hypothetical protein
MAELQTDQICFGTLILSRTFSLVNYLQVMQILALIPMSVVELS